MTYSGMVALPVRGSSILEEVFLPRGGVLTSYTVAVPPGPNEAVASRRTIVSVGPSGPLSVASIGAPLKVIGPPNGSAPGPKNPAKIGFVLRSMKAAPGGVVNRSMPGAMYVHPGMAV